MGLLAHRGLLARDLAWGLSQSGLDAQARTRNYQTK